MYYKMRVKKTAAADKRVGYFAFLDLPKIGNILDAMNRDMAHLSHDALAANRILSHSHNNCAPTTNSQNVLKFVKILFDCANIA